jgi:solute carrier family 25 iron transporter 28/37
MISEGVFTPLDAVKQRMQLRQNQYKNIIDCILKVVRTEGAGAFYAGYTTGLVMNVPYNAIYFSTYESLRHILKQGSKKEFDASAHFLSGAGAGAVAAALTNPFDVAKTRLQTQPTEGLKYRGIINTLTLIWKMEGKRGLTLGIVPRIVLNATSGAICWSVYEYTKIVLQRLGT